jgi:hypothetical protein
MNRYQFCDAGLTEMGPDSLDLRAVCQGLAHLDGRVRFRFGPLDDQLAFFRAGNDLPFEDASLFQPLRGVLADDVPLGVNELSDRLE